MKISIIIPAHNEEKTIAQVLEKVFEIELNGWEKEIIVVNDGSTDKTGEMAQKFVDDHRFDLSAPSNFAKASTVAEAMADRSSDKSGLLSSPLRRQGFGGQAGEKGNSEFINHSKNLGKGAAIQTGLKQASGDYVIIQDADAEYDPNDIPKLLSVIGNITPQPPLILRGGENPSPFEERGRGEVAVFGARGYKSYPERGFHYVIGAWALTVFYNILYHQKLTDLYTGYKLIPTAVFKSLNIQSTGFEFEAEVACKLARANVKIIEVPISYQPRNKNQGKHIRFTDAIKGLLKILYLRFKN